MPEGEGSAAALSPPPPQLRGGVSPPPETRRPRALRQRRDVLRTRQGGNTPGAVKRALYGLRYVNKRGDLAVSG